nr:unnamed protein product [Digitaria exilis]
MGSKMPPGTRSRPWADLPVELVELVLSRLDVFSVTLLAAVCAPWAMAVAAAKPSLPLGKPCLLASTKDDDRCSVLDLTDLVAGDRLWVGGKGAWLATIDARCNLQLLNPYTGDRIDLPAVSTIPGVEPNGGRRRRYGIRHLACPDDAFRKVVLCDTPSGGGAGGYLAVAIVAGRILAVARGGDRIWTSLTNHRDMWAGYDDAVVHKGNLFAVDAEGVVFSWDLSRAAAAGDDGTPCPYPRRLGSSWRSPRESVYQYNLAESGDGRRLLAVCTHGKYVKVEKKPAGATVDLFVAGGMLVKQLDVEANAGGWWWRPVTGLGGDRALLLGANWPIWATVGRGPPGQLLQPNCVYVAPAVLFGYPDEDFDVVVYDLSDKSCRQIKVCTGDRDDGFAIPIWFTPTLQTWNRRAS